MAKHNTWPLDRGGGEQCIHNTYSWPRVRRPCTTQGHRTWEQNAQPWAVEGRFGGVQRMGWPQVHGGRGGEAVAGCGWLV